jgi:NitT/TauT family transport system substrate-binding protein
MKQSGLPRSLRSISTLAGVLVSTLRAAILPAALLALGPVGCDDASAPRPSTDLAQGGTAAPELRKLRLQLNWVAEPEFGGFYAAEQKALYHSEGLDVELVQGGPDVPVPQLVASGKVEFGVVAGTQVIELNEQGGDLVALYAVYQVNPMGVMVHESSPYQTLMQLWESDVTLAIQDGLADYQWLSTQFPAGKRRIVPYTANLAQFAADPTLASQCFVLSEPVALELKGVKTRVFMMSESGFNPYNAVVVTTRPFLEANREACAAFVRASALGWRAYLNDPKAVNQEMSRLNPAMSLEAMTRAAEVQIPLIANDETTRLGLGGMRYSRWEETAGQLLQMGKIKSKPDAERLFHWDLEADTAR